jgi:hypothetical protein
MVQLHLHLWTLGTLLILRGRVTHPLVSLAVSSRPRCCRVLFTSDALANSTLIFLAFGIARLRANLPEHRSIQDVLYLGPKQPMFSLWAALPAYLCTSVIPLAWQLRWPDSYFKRRTAVVTAIRVVRLVFAAMTLGAYSASAPTLARIGFARALQAPNKAVAILIFQPQASRGVH